MKTELEILLSQIETKLDWGNSSNWQGKDFENLNQKIFDVTGVSLSASTLKRVWGKVEYNHLPSLTTLDTLSKFAGFENWRSFQRSVPSDNKITSQVDEVSPQPAPSPKSKSKIPFILAGIIIIGIVSLLAYNKSGKAVGPANYSFSSEPVTRDIPNSVIFKYDASNAPSDSIYIQQSWDMRTKTAVNKNEHTFTSIYYEPGFYQAKLYVDSQIVKEHPLMIPTKDWLGMIDHRPIPVYLKSEDYLKPDMLTFPQSGFQKMNIEMQPQVPGLKFYNVGNFEAVPIPDFSFSSQVKNDFNSGSAACQFTYILLITDGAPIIFPLSAKGCVSEIFLRAVDSVVMGKKQDLSGFGVDFKDWINISCKSQNGNLIFGVNDKEVFNCPLPSKTVNIVGLGFYFQGPGSVKNIRLYKKDKLDFQAF